MNYIIFDLEFNQSLNSKKENKNLIPSKCPFEIIQIGAIKLDGNLQVISTLDRLVKPELYTTMNPFVEEITGITIDVLNTAKPFEEIYKEFIEFVKDDRNILCVWGIADIKELFRNIEYHGLDISPVPKEYINLQLYASKYLNCPKGTNIGLENAVELLNIKLECKFHNAFNDAYYTSEVFKKVYNKNIEPNIYNRTKNSRLNRTNTVKKKIDIYKLMKQFEKMFNREMTTEEHEIIKLAYMMGKTRQFETDVSDVFNMLKKD